MNKPNMVFHMGTKVVFGSESPMTLKDYCEYMLRDLHQDANPEELVYLVEYAPDPESKPNHPNHEGYVSMSPVHVFEEAYRKNGSLTFGHAVAAVKTGKKACRSGWNGKGMYISLFNGQRGGIAVSLREQCVLKEDEILTVRPMLILRTAQDDLASWAPSGSDALAEDWMVLE